jgi:hypothetical protein
MGNERYNTEKISYGPGDDETVPDQAARLKELEAENARLERAVAVLTVDKLILEEVAEENAGRSARKYPSGR